MPDHRPLVVEEELGERPGELGLADAGRSEEQEASRSGGSGRTARPRLRRMAFATGRDRLVLADDALRAARPPCARACATSPSSEPGDGDAGPAADDLGDVLGVDLLLQHPLVGLELGRASVAASMRRSSSGSSP